MKKIPLLLLMFTTNLCVSAQVSDFITLKKRNGLTVASFYEGSRINFEASTGTPINAAIEKIRNDSIYLRFYELRPYYTSCGTKGYDTLSSYLFPLHYTDIEFVYRDAMSKKRLGWWLSKRIWIGAAGYITLNLINSLLYYKNGFTDKANLMRLAIAAGAFGTGFYFDKQSKINNYSPRRFTIVYVKMN